MEINVEITQIISFVLNAILLFICNKYLGIEKTIIIAFSMLLAKVD